RDSAGYKPAIQQTTSLRYEPWQQGKHILGLSPRTDGVERVRVAERRLNRGANRALQASLCDANMFSGVRPSSGAAGLGASETWKSCGVLAVETLLLPRTAALRALNTYLAEPWRRQGKFPSNFLL